MATRRSIYAKDAGRNQVYVYEDLVAAGKLKDNSQEQIGSIDLF